MARAIKEFLFYLLAAILVFQLMIPMPALAQSNGSEEVNDTSVEESENLDSVDESVTVDNLEDDNQSSEAETADGSKEDYPNETVEESHSTPNEANSLKESSNTDFEDEHAISKGEESAAIEVDIEGSTTQEYKPGMHVTINVHAPQGEQFKFVWEKDNWADWGVAQDFSDSATCTWTPTESGVYTLHVDVKDATGKKVTETIQVNLTENWTFDSISITPTEASVVKDPATIEVKTSGNNESLQYKFVWEKNNWADWGVAQEFSESPICTWTPATSGIYTLHVDIKDSTGKKVTKTQTYTVSNIALDIEGSTTQEYKPGMHVTINVHAPQGEQFKFVWEKDNWADWGVAQDFSDSATCTWTPTESGVYTLHVDVKDATGKKVTETIQVNLTENWTFDSISITPTEASVVKDPATIEVKTSGNNESLQYKFVWEKNNWADWGVAQEFSESPICTWTPATSGIYTLHVDIKDSTGKKVTKTQTYTVA